MGDFSLWCDFIENSFLDNEFLDMLNEGLINGATSNPAIFKNAILSSPAYKKSIEDFKGEDKTKLYESLIVKDIAKAANKLALNYFKEDDGFISVEINPHLAKNTQGSLAEAFSLYSAIGKPNVMIKLPATEESYEVMSKLLAAGINVNATLVFSVCQTKKCLNAMQKGLALFRKNPGSQKAPQAVISVFVSRFDRVLNPRVIDKDIIGILNATKCYNAVQKVNEPNIRTLFASTGTKDEHLAKDYYIKELLFPHCVNTAPLDALAAFKRELNPSFKQALSDDECDEMIARNLPLKEVEKLAKDLLEDGLTQFEQAYDEILASL